MNNPFRFEHPVRLTVSTRLRISLALVALLSASFAVSSWVQQRQSGEQLTRMKDRDLEHIIRIKYWVALSDKTAMGLMAANQSFDPQISTLLDGENAANLKQLDALQGEISSWADSPPEREWFKAFRPLNDGVKESIKKIREMRMDGDLPEAATYFKNEMTPRLVAYRKSIEVFDKLENERLKLSIVAARDAGQRLWMVSTVALMVGVAAVCAFLLRLVNYLRRFLNRAIGVTEAVASGDLSVRLVAERDDEFGQLGVALSAMADSLSNVVQRVVDCTETISVASSEIAQGNLDLSNRTEVQAASIQRTAATMCELSGDVRRTADNAQEAASLARNASDVAERGGAAVSQVVGTMTAIDGASRRIEEITSVIDSISFQTNILALNAAIEAARAGEHGRGFSVVAGEVRQLASRSATAAREIKDLVADSVSKAHAGSDEVQNAGRTISELVGCVRRVSDLITAISESAQRQNRGLDEVSGSVSALDNSTQQNAALVEQAAAAAASLRGQAEAMTRVIAVFRTEAAAA